MRIKQDGRWLVALVMLMVCLGGAGEAAGEVRCEPGDGERLGLAEVWDAVWKGEPRGEATDYEVAAARAEERGWRREGRPEVRISGEGDVGRRISPGAERDQGVSARTQAGLELTTDVLNRERRAAERWQASQINEAEARVSVVREEIKQEVAEIYLGLFENQRRWELLIAHAERVGGLAKVVDRRVEAGVEASHERRGMEDMKAAIRREKGQVAQGRRTHAERLAQWVGDCVEAADMGLAGALAIDGGESEGASIEWLERRAVAMRAEGDWRRREDSLWLQGVAAGRGVLSPAYDNRPEPEYFAGFRWQWRPDLRGVRQEQQRAREMEAKALEMEAQSRRDARQRAMAALARIEESWEERLGGMEDERRSAQTYLEVAEARWRQGVGHWSDVMAGYERVYGAEQEALDYQVELIEEVLVLAMESGDMAQMSRWLETESG